MRKVVVWSAMRLVAGNVEYLVSEDKDLLILGDRLGVRSVDAQTFMALFESSET